MRRLAAPSIILATIALIFAGCGGGDEDTTTASSTGSTRETPSQGSKDTAGQKKQPTSADNTTSDKSASGGTPQEGSKAPAPGVPVTKGGDNSIQTYGLEASSGDRAEITALVQSYLDAIAAGNWAKACSYLTSSQQQQYDQFAQALKVPKGSGCPAVLGKLNSRIPKKTRVSDAKIDVLSLRIGDDNPTGQENAFLIFKGADGKVYATVATREDDQWKLLNGSRTPLNPTAPG
ncbi:MAG TPA: hypothetical protein VF176_05515 [Solirubrobacterales bacterium]